MNRIKELRESKQLNMAQAAKALGMKYTTYVSYEKGDREPNSEALILLASFYDVSVDYLLGRDISSNTEKHVIKTSRSDEYASMFSQLDDHDQGVIIGEMKQMLRADKYQVKAKEA